MYFASLHLANVQIRNRWRLKWPQQKKMFIEPSDRRKNYRMCLENCSMPFNTLYTPKPYTHPSCLPYVPHVPPISFLMIWSTEQNPVKNKVHNSSLCCLLHTVLTSLLLGPNIHFNIQFWNNLNLNIKDQFYSRTNQQHKLQSCATWSSFFLKANSKTKYSALNDKKHSLNSMLFYIRELHAFTSLIFWE